MQHANVRAPAHSVEDGINAWADFIPAPNGSTGKYQFTAGQVAALYPQLATATPFFLSWSQAQQLSTPYTVSEGAGAGGGVGFGVSGFKPQAIVSVRSVRSFIVHYPGDHYSNQQVW